ncbi:hypothetical protein AB1Y20_006728 [Prymnesium parvum]|uniref:Exonuclease domain-containing protein n=1 Tax=Prymnesium parvum TaxID=97485 RepID=A0AB34J0N9_PRYPA
MFDDDFCLPDDVLATGIDLTSLAERENKPMAPASRRAPPPGKGTCGSTPARTGSAPANGSCVQLDSHSDDACGGGASKASRMAWGSLRPATSSDMKGRGQRRKGLQAPPPKFTHLVVLDFEWTADKGRGMHPCAEITQFPSVLVEVNGRSSRVLDEFDTFCQPRFNPTLSRFSIQLTGITQLDVDAAPLIEEVLPRYLGWLQSHGLVTESGERVGSWSFVTWSDADIGGTLSTELWQKGMKIPQCFDRWIDLKLLYARHYRMEPSGGLRACVERIGLFFEGREHNGLVDSRNTALIALHMARGSMTYGAYTFCRGTSGLDKNGFTYGSRAAKRLDEAVPVPERKKPAHSARLLAQNVRGLWAASVQKAQSIRLDL